MGEEGASVDQLDERYALPVQRLVEAVLTTPGETNPSLRQAIEEQVAHLTLHSAQKVATVPPELTTYIQKVALAAYKITDEDTEALQQAGYGEDAIFEITLSAALSAAMLRLQRGLSALKGANDATESH